MEGEVAKPFTLDVWDLINKTELEERIYRLRIDEAMHPLSFLAMGLYGKTLPAQNVAPIRLVVPWKYGFKSIVSIRLVEEIPPTSWNLLAPNDYGNEVASLYQGIDLRQWY